MPFTIRDLPFWKEFIIPHAQKVSESLLETDAALASKLEVAAHTLEGALQEAQEGKAVEGYFEASAVNLLLAANYGDSTTPQRNKANKFLLGYVNTEGSTGPLGGAFRYFSRVQHLSQQYIPFPPIARDPLTSGVLLFIDFVGGTAPRVTGVVHRPNDSMETAARSLYGLPSSEASPSSEYVISLFTLSHSKGGKNALAELYRKAMDPSHPLAEKVATLLRSQNLVAGDGDRIPDGMIATILSCVQGDGTLTVAGFGNFTARGSDMMTGSIRASKSLDLEKLIAESEGRHGDAESLSGVERQVTDILDAPAKKLLSFRQPGSQGARLIHDLIGVHSKELPDFSYAEARNLFQHALKDEPEKMVALINGVSLPLSEVLALIYMFKWVRANDTAGMLLLYALWKKCTNGPYNPAVFEGIDYEGRLADYGLLESNGGLKEIVLQVVKHSLFGMSGFMRIKDPTQKSLFPTPSSSSSNEFGVVEPIGTPDETRVLNGSGSDPKKPIAFSGFFAGDRISSDSRNSPGFIHRLVRTPLAIRSQPAIQSGSTVFQHLNRIGCSRAEIETFRRNVGRGPRAGFMMKQALAARSRAEFIRRTAGVEGSQSGLAARTFSPFASGRTSFQTVAMRVSR